MLDFSQLSERERLIAEQAVLAQRCIDERVKDAPSGQGLNVVEGAIQEVGLPLLTALLRNSLESRPETTAKKGGRGRSARAGRTSTIHGPSPAAF